MKEWRKDIWIKEKYKKCKKEAKNTRDKKLESRDRIKTDSTTVS